MALKAIPRKVSKKPNWKKKGFWTGISLVIGGILIGILQLLI